MARLFYKVLLDAPMEAVWAYHEDIRTALAELSPPEAQAQVTQADAPGLGAMVTIRANAPPLGRVKWTARYAEYQPPTGEPPSRVAWFTDEQVNGPFKQWRHTHRFEETLDEGREKVWASDSVEYTPPMGLLGMMANRLLIRRQIDKLFAHRHAVLRRRLSRRG